MKIKNLSMLLGAALLVGVALSSCTSSEHPGIQSQEESSDDVSYASLLTMQEVQPHATLCRIRNPWDTTQFLAQYLLYASADSLTPKQLEKIEEQVGACIRIETPIQRITLTNSCHAYLLLQLHADSLIKVLCDAQYIQSPLLQQRLQDKHLLDGGNSMSPNIEVMLQAQSDAVFVSPFENGGLGALRQISIPIIFCADYMEFSPLGRAEWMRFYGRLIGRQHEADSLFATIEKNYLELCRCISADSLHHKPTLLSELTYGASWYVPAGHSTMGQLYNDAGAQYFWAQENQSGSISLSPEKVLEVAANCERWLFKYFDNEHDMTLQDLSELQIYYSQFKAFKTHNVYACNTAHSLYFDEVPFHPDYLLHDVARLLADSTTLYVNDSVFKAMDNQMPRYFEKLRP